MGGGTSSATAAVVNNIPRASRSTAVAFFARMDVWACGAEEEVAVTGGGGEDGGVLRRRRGAAMMSRWRLREQVLDGAMRADGGWRRTR